MFDRDNFRRYLFEFLGLESSRDSRLSRARLTTITSIVARGCQSVAVFGTIPLVIGHLGKETYGIWMTLASLSFIFSFVDLGIGNGVLNRVSEALGRNDLESARGTISTGSGLLLLETLLLIIISIYIAYTLPLEGILNTGSSISHWQLRDAAAAMFVCQLLTIPFSLTNKMQLAFQEGYIGNLWTIFGYVGAFCTSWVVLACGNGLVALVLAYSGASLLAAISNCLHFYLFRHRGFWPTWQHFSLLEFKPLFRLGMWFLLIQIAGSVAFASDNLVITSFFGPSGVAEYAVPQRVFQMVSLVVVLYVNPLWPAYTEASVTFDVNWIRQTLLRSIRNVVLFLLVVSVALLFVSTPLLDVIGRGQVSPTVGLLVALVFWNVLQALGSSTAVFLNAVNAVRVQVPFALGMAASSILLKILLAPRYGLVGVVLGGIIAYGVFSVLPQLLIVRRELKRLEISATRKKDSNFSPTVPNCAGE